jgi:hypothetical protein
MLKTNKERVDQRKHERKNAEVKAKYTEKVEGN